MFVREFAGLASVTLLLAFASGCAAESGEAAGSDEAALANRPVVVNPDDEGTFKLYEDNTVTPDAACDRHTVLDLSHPSANAALTASLHDEVDGVCKLAVDTAARLYALKLGSVECGSKIYKGTNGDREITITDHRERFCRDVVPAQVIVEETEPSARHRTLLSLDSNR